MGCFDDELFNHIDCQKKVGVDPVSGGTIRETSDNFFKKNNETFDCIFIDGLHKYNQVKRDIINSLKVLNDGGVILLHDCLPNNYYAQAIPRCQWFGMRRLESNYRVWNFKNVDVYTCYADHGIGVILKRPNRNLLDYPKTIQVKI